MIPYGKQFIDEADIDAVVEVLRSDMLTTGPKIAEFEEKIADYVGVKHAVAVSSGTAALHCAMFAIGIQPGDEVIVPTMTFAATANSIVYQGGTPVFVDVEPETLLIDPIKVEAAITEKTKAIIAVDYAGQPCEYDQLRSISMRYGLTLVADACHSLGAEYKGKMVGSLADLTVFSFHPVKHITTGEGGMVTTDNEALAKKMRRFRNHGINTEHHQRARQKTWIYEMVELGYNYRINDIQCALGLSQLNKLTFSLSRRREIAECYNIAFEEIPGIDPLGLRKDLSGLNRAVKSGKPDGEVQAPSSTPSYHAYHLFVIQVNNQTLTRSRVQIFEYLRDQGIGVNVHYIPVHLHPYYKDNFGTTAGLCPVAEYAYERIISIPNHPYMTDEEVKRVITSMHDAVHD